MSMRYLDGYNIMITKENYIGKLLTFEEYNKITNNQTLKKKPTKISFPKVNGKIMVIIKEWND